MTEKYVKSEDELKAELLDFAKGIYADFPQLGITEKSMSRMERDIMEYFCVETIINVGAYLGIRMKNEAEKCLTPGYLEAVLAIANEHIDFPGPNGDPEVLAKAKDLKRILELELRRGRLARSAEETEKKFNDLVEIGLALTDVDAMRGIYSGFIEMATGKKPEEIPGFAGNLELAEKVMRLFDLKDISEKLNAERTAIMKEAGPKDNMKDLDATILARDVLAFELNRLPKNPDNFEAISKKKNIGTHLSTMRKVVKIRQADLKWANLGSELGEFFEGEIAGQRFPGLVLRNPKIAEILAEQ